MADLTAEQLTKLKQLTRHVWVREDANGHPQQSALWESRVKPNREQLELGHRTARYIPAESAKAEAQPASAEQLARRIVCRALDIDPEQPSEAIEAIFAPLNTRGEFAVEEARAAIRRAKAEAQPAPCGDLGQVCGECGAHWMTDAQLDTLDARIKPWRDRALAAEAQPAGLAKLRDAWERYQRGDLSQEEFEGTVAEMVETPGEGMARAVAKQNARAEAQPAGTAVAEVLEVGSAPNGQNEVILACSPEEARQWGKLLYTRIEARALSPKRPTKARKASK